MKPRPPMTDPSVTHALIRIVALMAIVAPVMVFLIGPSTSHPAKAQAFATWETELFSPAPPPGVIGYAHVVASGGGLALGIDVHGDYAYVGDWGGLRGSPTLQVFDVTDPTNPQLILTSPRSASQEIGDLAVDGNLACVANDANGLAVYDVSDPTNPLFLASRREGGVFAHSVYYEGGDYAYVGYNWQTSDLAIYDLSSLPTLPAPTVYQVVGNQVWDVEVSGSRAYVISEWGSCSPGGYQCFEVVDVTVPTTPTHISSISLNKSLYGNLGEMRKVGDHVYVAAGPQGGPAGLRVIDVTDEANPALIGSADVTDTAGPFAKSYGLAVDGPRAYLAAAAGLYVFDIVDPANPTQVDLLTWPAAFGPTRGGHVEVRGDLAYVAVYGDESLSTAASFGGLAIMSLGGNQPPTADAGPDQSVAVPVGQSVQLDGSGSSDDHTPTANLGYAWTLIGKPGGSSASLTGANTATPSFVPDVDGDYTAELVVTDEGSLMSDPDQVLISIAVDDPPVADAGPDQLAFTGASVQLDGSLSNDDLTASVNLLYAWTITSAPASSTASLVGDATPTPTFVPDLAGSYAIDLVVTDESSQASLPDQVVITASVPNAAPTADAGSDATGATNVAIQLDGSGSSDPDLDPLTFQWTLTIVPASSAATLVGGTTATPTLIPDLPGTYVAELVVNDGMVDSSPDTVEVEAIDAADFAQAKIRDADGLVAALPLSAFYSGSSSNPWKQARKAKWSKRGMRWCLRYAGWRVRRLDHAAQCGCSHAVIQGKKKSALRALRQAILKTDGVSLRGTPDERGSGFRLDLIVDPAAAMAVYDCLVQARTAVEAVQ